MSKRGSRKATGVPGQNVDSNISKGTGKEPNEGADKVQTVGLSGNIEDISKGQTIGLSGNVEDISKGQTKGLSDTGETTSGKDSTTLLRQVLEKTVNETGNIDENLLKEGNMRTENVILKRPRDSETVVIRFKNNIVCETPCVGDKNSPKLHNGCIELAKDPRGDFYRTDDPRDNLYVRDKDRVVTVYRPKDGTAAYLSIVLTRNMISLFPEKRWPDDFNEIEIQFTDGNTPMLKSYVCISWDSISDKESPTVQTFIDRIDVYELKYQLVGRYSSFYNAKRIDFSVVYLRHVGKANKTV